MRNFTKEEQVIILELARMTLADNYEAVAEALDLSDEVLKDLQDKIVEHTGDIV